MSDAFLLQLELLDPTRLKGHRELRLAHLQLCLITAGYVWQDGDSGIAKVTKEFYYTVTVIAIFL